MNIYLYEDYIIYSPEDRFNFQNDISYSTCDFAAVLTDKCRLFSFESERVCDCFDQESTVEIILTYKGRSENTRKHLPGTFEMLTLGEAATV